MKHINISERIVRYRLENKLTQEEFGALLGVSAQAVSKWERVVCYPDITVLYELSRILGCTVDEFYEQR